jgi:biotin carboxyl carrier protein
MKEMKEVTSDCDGEVIDITVSDGELVEYGSVLMKIY